MTCEQFVRHLSEYLDDELAASLRADAEEHLNTCEKCHVVLDTTQRSILLYRAAAREGLPAARKADLLRRLSAAFRIQGTGPA